MAKQSQPSDNTNKSQSANRPQLSDKVKKLRDGVQLHIYGSFKSEEDGGITTGEAVKDGEVVARFVKKGDKVVETSASVDAQETGMNEKAAAAFGVKKDQLTNTSASGVADNMGDIRISDGKQKVGSLDAKSAKTPSAPEKTEKAKLSAKMEEVKPKDPKDGKVDNSMSSMSKTKTDLKKAMDIKNTDGRLVYSRQPKPEYKTEPAPKLNAPEQKMPVWKQKWSQKSPEQRMEISRNLSAQRAKMGKSDKTEKLGMEVLEKPKLLRDLKTYKKWTTSGRPFRILAGTHPSHTSLAGVHHVLDKATSVADIHQLIRDPSSGIANKVNDALKKGHDALYIHQPGGNMKKLEKQTPGMGVAAESIKNAFGGGATPPPPPPPEPSTSGSLAGDITGALNRRFGKSELSKDNKPHAPNTPEDKAHDVIEEGDSLKHAMSVLKAPENICKMFAHLRASKGDADWKRNQENQAAGKESLDKARVDEGLSLEGKVRARQERNVRNVQSTKTPTGQPTRTARSGARREGELELGSPVYSNPDAEGRPMNVRAVPAERRPGEKIVGTPKEQLESKAGVHMHSGSFTHGRPVVGGGPSSSAPVSANKEGKTWRIGGHAQQKSLSGPGPVAHYQVIAALKNLRNKLGKSTWIGNPAAPEPVIKSESLDKKQGVPKGVDPAKHERCVKDVKAKGGAVNPWAVCSASLQKMSKMCKAKLEKRKTLKPLLSWINMADLKQENSEKMKAYSGKVLGSFQNGKILHNDANHPDHANFEPIDHMRAAAQHTHLANERESGKQYLEAAHHRKQAFIHRNKWKEMFAGSKLSKADEESPGVKLLRERMKSPHKTKPGSTDEKIRAALEAQGSSGHEYGTVSQPDKKSSRDIATEKWGRGSIDTERNKNKRTHPEREQASKDIPLIEKLLARYDKPEATIAKKYNKTGHDEPYVGADLHNIVYSTKDGTEKSNIAIPVTGPIDVKGHLGKRVANGGNDPLAWLDSKYGVSKRILQEHKGKPLKISTRSDLIARDDYMEHLDPKNHHVFMHIASDDDSGNVIRLLEPGAPSFKRRLEAAQKLKDAGHKVTFVHDVSDNLPKENNRVNHLRLQKLGFDVTTNKMKTDEASRKRTHAAIGTVGNSMEHERQRQAERGESQNSGDILQHAKQTNYEPKEVFSGESGSKLKAFLASAKRKKDE